MDYGLHHFTLHKQNIILCVIKTIRIEIEFTPRIIYRPTITTVACMISQFDLRTLSFRSLWVSNPFKIFIATLHSTIGYFNPNLDGDSCHSISGMSPVVEYDSWRLMSNCIFAYEMTMFALCTFPVDMHKNAINFSSSSSLIDRDNTQMNRWCRRTYARHCVRCPSIVQPVNLLGRVCACACAYGNAAIWANAYATSAEP